MSMTKRQLLAGLAGVSGAALLPGLASGQELTFGPTVLREDFDVLRRAWTTMHPGLYRYNTERDIARLFSRAAGWANRERSLAEAFVQLAAMSAALRCGHTFPNPANQGRRVREALLDQRRCVPFAFRWIDREMIVTAALPGVDLRAGDRILRLDGVRAAELRRRLMPLMRADGGNDAKRLRLMSVDPKDDHGTFDLFRGLAFGAAEMCRVELERDGARLAVEAATVLPDVRSGFFSPPAENEGWTFEIIDGVGRLFAPTWAMYNTDWDWRGFIDSAVDQLIDSGARGLIVDLRSNEGGLDCGDVLLERLIEQPLAPERARTLVRYRQAPAELDPYLDTWDPSFKNWGDQAVGPDARGFYELRRGEEVDGPLMPRGRRFTGRVAVLVDASNSSATFQFARKVKENGLATLFGETTGGSRRGINGGAYFFFRLPNTRIEVDLPLIGYFPETPQPDEGVHPDRRVAQTREDIFRGYDRVMAAALDDINSA